MFVPAPLPSILRQQAVELRLQGLAISVIAAELGVSPASVSKWTRTVTLTEEQLAELRRHQSAHHAEGVLKRSQNCLEKRRAAQEEGRRRVAANDPLHLAGCMLYWAEGSKETNSLKFVNSDPAMVDYFVRFLVTCYEIPLERLRVRVNCFLNNGLSLDEIEDWWVERLRVPRACLQRAIVNKPSRASKGKRRVLPYGTVTLTLNSTAVLQSIYGAIQEYAGFEQPEWLETRTARVKRLELRAV
jgi:predicted transcriptional regulator